MGLVERLSCIEPLGVNMFACSNNTSLYLYSAFLGTQSAVKEFFLMGSNQTVRHTFQMYALCFLTRS